MSWEENRGIVSSHKLSLPWCSTCHTGKHPGSFLQWSWVQRWRTAPGRCLCPQPSPAPKHPGIRRPRSDGRWTRTHVLHCPAHRRNRKSFKSNQSFMSIAQYHNFVSKGFTSCTTYIMSVFVPMCVTMCTVPERLTTHVTYTLYCMQRARPAANRQLMLHVILT